MKVASDVLGDLKVAYVDKTIINKLDEHRPLEDLDALNLIGGYFQPAIKQKESIWHWPTPLTIFMRKRKKKVEGMHIAN